VLTRIVALVLLAERQPSPRFQAVARFIQFSEVLVQSVNIFLPDGAVENLRASWKQTGVRPTTATTTGWLTALALMMTELSSTSRQGAGRQNIAPASTKPVCAKSLDESADSYL
jgi:hypothetical protein